MRGGTDRLHDGGRPVTVQDGPPRRDAVDDAAAVGKREEFAIGGNDGERFVAAAQRRIRMPDTPISRDPKGSARRSRFRGNAIVQRRCRDRFPRPFAVGHRHLQHRGAGNVAFKLFHGKRIVGANERDRGQFHAFESPAPRRGCGQLPQRLTMPRGLPGGQVARINSICKTPSVKGESGLPKVSMSSGASVLGMAARISATPGIRATCAACGQERRHRLLEAAPAAQTPRLVEAGGAPWPCPIHPSRPVSSKPSAGTLPGTPAKTPSCLHRYPCQRR